MAIIGEAEVAVRANTTKFGPEASAGVESSMKGVLTKVAGAIAAFQIGRKIAQEIGKAITEAREANKVAAQTAAVIKSTGGVANVTAKQVQDLADALAKKTGADDEAVASAENVLLTFTAVRNSVGAGNDIFNQATQAILDMSTALGTDLQGSTIQVGKALQDPVKGITALRRVGVAFSQSQIDVVKSLVASGNLLGAQKLILKELTTEFGGSAEAVATPTKKLQAQFKIFREEIGKQFIVVIDKVATVILKALPGSINVARAAFERLSPVAQKVAQVVGLAFQQLIPTLKPIEQIVGEVARAVAGALAKVVEAFDKLAKNQAVVAAFKGVVTAFGGVAVSVFRLISAAILPIGQVLSRLDFGKALAVNGGGSGILVKVLGAIKSALEGIGSVADGLAPIIGAAFDLIAAALQPFVDFVGTHLGPVLDRIIGSGPAVQSSLGPATEGIRGFIEAATKNPTALAAVQASIAGIVVALLSFKTVGGIVGIINNITKAVIALDAAMDANPVGLVVAGIAALIAVVIVAYLKIKPFRDLIDSIGRFFRDTFGPTLVKVAGVIREGVTKAFEFLVSSVFPRLRTAFEVTVRFFERVGGAIAGAVRVVVPIVEGIFKTVVGAIEAAIPRIGAAVGAVGRFFQRVFDVAVRVFNAVRENAIDPFLKWYEKNVAPTVRAGVEFAVVLFTRIGQVAQFVFRGVRRTVEDFVAGFRIVEPVFAAVGKVIIGALQTIFRIAVPILKAIGTAIAFVFETALPIVATALRVIGEVIATGFRIVVAIVGPILGAIVDTVVAIFNTIKAVIEGALRILKGIFEIGTAILTLNWSKAWQGIKDIVAGVWHIISGVVSTALDFVRSLIGRGIDLIAGVFRAGFEGFITIVSTVIDGVIKFFSDLPGRIISALASIGTDVWAAAQIGFDFISTQVGGVVDTVIGFFTGLPGRIISGLSTLGQDLWAGIQISFEFVRDKIGGIVTSVVGFFTGLPQQLGSALSGIEDFITAPFRSAFKAIANIWNSSVGSLSFTLPKWIPEIGGQGFSFPKIPVDFAAGGIVPPTPGGVFARLAEAGRGEAVLPLLPGVLDGLQAIARASKATSPPPTQLASSSGPLVGQLIVQGGGNDPTRTGYEVVRQMNAEKWRKGG